jgi:hypothetical protein
LSATTPEKGNAEGRIENEEIRRVAIWRAALVLPQARRVLETQLRKLALDANCFSFFMLPSSFWHGAAAGNCTRTIYLAGRHSTVKPQPRK